MKNLFIPCAFSNLRMNEFFSLINLVHQAAEAMVTTEAAKPMIADLGAAAKKLDDSLKQSAVNKYTASVELADQAVDEAWSGIWSMAKTMLKHPGLERRSAAAEVYDLMYKYGNPTKLAYKDEYGRLRNLTQDLDALGTEKLAKTYLDEWFAELKKQIATFHAADEKRMSEEDAYQVGISKAARDEAEEALRTFLKKIEALAIINGEEEYAGFATRVNTLFGEAKATLKSRQTKGKNKTGGTPDTSLPGREPDPEIDGEKGDASDSESPDEI